MGNKLEKPDPNEWASAQAAGKKNYCLNGQCTAVFDEQVRNCSFMYPGCAGALCAYQQLATGRCLNTMADENDTAATDQVLKLFDPGVK